MLSSVSASHPEFSGGCSFRIPSAIPPGPFASKLAASAMSTMVTAKKLREETASGDT